MNQKAHCDVANSDVSRDLIKPATHYQGDLKSTPEQVRLSFVRST